MNRGGDKGEARTTQQIYPCVDGHLLPRRFLLLHHFERLIQYRLPRQSGVDDFYYPFRHGKLSPRSIPYDRDAAAKRELDENTSS